MRGFVLEIWFQCFETAKGNNFETFKWVISVILERARGGGGWGGGERVSAKLLSNDDGVVH
jgi:hypothetical protein